MGRSLGVVAIVQRIHQRTETEIEIETEEEEEEQEEEEAEAGAEVEAEVEAEGPPSSIWRCRPPTRQKRPGKL